MENVNKVVNAVHITYNIVYYIISRYFCRGEEATRSIITNCHFVLLFQSENGLREIGPRKDRNAAPLCHGNVFSAFCFFSSSTAH